MARTYTSQRRSTEAEQNAADEARDARRRGAEQRHQGDEQARFVQTADGSIALVCGAFGCGSSARASPDHSADDVVALCGGCSTPEGTPDELAGVGSSTARERAAFRSRRLGISPEPLAPSVRHGFGRDGGAR